MVLAQAKVAGKSNEITTLPALLDLLDLQGRTVTLDAMQTQRETARALTDAGGNYICALKSNQKHGTRMSNCFWTIPIRHRPSRSQTPMLTRGMAGVKPAPHRCVMTVTGWGHMMGRPWRRWDQSQHNARYRGNRVKRPAPFL